MAQPALQGHVNQPFVDQALAWLQSEATLPQALDFYEDFVKDPNSDDWTIAQIGLKDRFFLLTHLCNRADAIHPWMYERCREVEADPDEYLDLWARDHYKSTWITFVGSIQEILNNPDITIGIFSHTRPIAKAFLAQIMREFEYNETLKQLYPDILWKEPRREAPLWSLDSGIIVKRKSNPKESTVESWGLVDGQPVSKHFQLAIFDDVVTKASVNTSDQILKTTEAWELAQNLTSSANPRRWHIGTRYNFADTWGALIRRGVLSQRIYPATNDGTPTGKPVFLSDEVWQKKKLESSTYTIACQQLQNPIAGSEQVFDPEWIRYWEVRPTVLNVYIMVDYAGSRALTGSSNTAIAAIGIDANRNKLLIDGVCHKMRLSERWNQLKQMRKYWINQPGIQTVKVGYERYGAQSDIEHFEEMMRIEGNPFPIEELNWPRDGNHAKDERIKRLQPDHENWRFFYPLPKNAQKSLTKLQLKAAAQGDESLIARPIRSKDENGKIYNVFDKFMENEYSFFPNTTYKDFFDAMSRIYDMDISPPHLINDADTLPEVPED